MRNYSFQRLLFKPQTPILKLYKTVDYIYKHLPEHAKLRSYVHVRDLTLPRKSTSTAYLLPRDRINTSVKKRHELRYYRRNNILRNT